MPGIFEIKNGVLKNYHGEDTRVIIPDNVNEINQLEILHYSQKRSD